MHCCRIFESLKTMLNSMTEYFRKNVKFCIALIVKKE